MTESQSKFETLRDILIGDELKQQKFLDEQLLELKEKVAQREKLQQDVEPLIEERMMQLKREFPAHFGPAFTKTLKVQIEENPNEIKALLAPLIQDLVNEQLDDKWLGLKSKFGLSKKATKDPTSLYRDQVEKEDEFETIHKATLNDIFIVENSKLKLIGYKSRFEGDEDKHTKELLLKTIKEKLKESLEDYSSALDWSEFDTYKIYLLGFKRISIACTVAGNPDDKFKNRLEDEVMEYAKDLLPELDADNVVYNQKVAQRLLASHFKF